MAYQRIGRSRPAIAFLAAAVFLLTAGFSATPAHALPPPVNGSDCDKSWVNNAGAMACFIQGEDDAAAGAAHPHYVACIPKARGGQIYCCVDNDAGYQSCEAVDDLARSTEAQKIQAILGAHRTLLMSLGRYSGKGPPLQSEIPNAPRKAAP